MKKQSVRLHMNIKESDDCVSHLMFHVVVVSFEFMYNNKYYYIKTNIIKRFHNSNVSEITVRTGIDECISAAETMFSESTRTVFVSPVTIE